MVIRATNTAVAAVATTSGHGPAFDLWLGIRDIDPSYAGLGGRETEAAEAGAIAMVLRAAADILEVRSWTWLTVLRS